MAIKRSSSEDKSQRLPLQRKSKLTQPNVAGDSDEEKILLPTANREESEENEYPKETKSKSRSTPKSPPAQSKKPVVMGLPV